MVIRDCCADTELGLQAALLDKLFLKRGTVIDAADFGG